VLPLHGVGGLKWGVKKAKKVVGKVKKVVQKA
jgi:hypothetical protein